VLVVPGWLGSVGSRSASLARSDDNWKEKGVGARHGIDMATALPLVRVLSVRTLSFHTGVGRSKIAGDGGFAATATTSDSPGSTPPHSRRHPSGTFSASSHASDGRSSHGSDDEIDSSDGTGSRCTARTGARGASLAVEVEALADGELDGSAVTVAAMTNASLLVLHKSAEGRKQWLVSCSMRTRGMCLSNDLQCLLTASPSQYGLLLHLLPVIDLHDEWDRCEGRSRGRAPVSSAPSLVELSRGRRLQQGRSQVKEALVEPMYLTAIESKDRWGRNQPWLESDHFPPLPCLWWQTAEGSHFAVLGGGEFAPSPRGHVYFVNLESLATWAVPLPKDSAVVSLGIVALAVPGDCSSGENHALSISNGPKGGGSDHGQENEAEEGEPPTARLLIATTADGAAYCIALEMGVCSSAPLGEAPVRDDYWCREDMTKNGRTVGIVQLRPPASVRLTQVPPHTKTFMGIEVLGLSEGGTELFILRVPANIIFPPLLASLSAAAAPIPLLGLGGLSGLASVALETKVRYRMPPLIVLEHVFTAVEGFIVFSGKRVSDKALVYSLASDGSAELNSETDADADAEGVISSNCGSVVAYPLPDGEVMRGASAAQWVGGAILWTSGGVYHLLAKDKAAGRWGSTSELSSEQPKAGGADIKAREGGGRKLLRRAQVLYSRGSYSEAIGILISGLTTAAVPPGGGRTPPSPHRKVQFEAQQRQRSPAKRSPGMRLPHAAFASSMAEQLPIIEDAVRERMADCVVKWMIQQINRGNTDFKESQALHSFLQSSRDYNLRTTITSLMEAGMVDEAVDISSDRGHSGVSCLCEVLLRGAGGGLWLSGHHVRILCQRGGGGALAAAGDGFLLSVLHLSSQLTVALSDRTLLIRYPQLAQRLSRRLHELPSAGLAKLASQLSQWWAYDATAGAGVPVGTALDFEPELLLEALLLLSGRGQGEAWRKAFCLGTCKDLSEAILAPPSVQGRLNLPLEEAASRLLRCVRSEPTLAGVTGTEEESEAASTLALPAQRLLVRATLVLVGKYDDARLLARAMDVQNWPIAAAVLSLGGCCCDAMSMLLRGVLQLVETDAENRCPPSTVLSGMAGDRVTEAQPHPQMMHQVSGHCLELLECAICAEVESSGALWWCLVTARLFSQLACIWLYLTFPAALLSDFITAHLPGSPLLQRALALVYFPEVYMEDPGVRGGDGPTPDQRAAAQSFALPSSTRFDILYRACSSIVPSDPLGQVSRAWALNQSLTLHLREMETESGEIHPPIMKLPAQGLSRPSVSSAPLGALPVARFQHQVRAVAGDTEGDSRIIVFSCGHRFSRSDLLAR
jgi:hypothetical protein